jgi:hypothetical protein
VAAVWSNAKGAERIDNKIVDSKRAARTACFAAHGSAHKMRLPRLGMLDEEPAKATSSATCRTSTQHKEHHELTTTQSTRAIAKVDVDQSIKELIVLYRHWCEMRARS